MLDKTLAVKLIGFVAIFFFKIVVEEWDGMIASGSHEKGSVGKERENKTENVFEEIMAENFPNLKKETNIKVQEAQRAPNKMNPNRPY